MRDKLYSLHLFTFCFSFDCVCVPDFDWFRRVRVCFLYVGLIPYYFTRYVILFNNTSQQFFIIRDSMVYFRVVRKDKCSLLV